MNEYNINETNAQETAEEQSSFNFQAIYTAVILNWKWFLLSAIICIGLGMLYLRYSTPVYNVTAKLLIKDDNSGNNKGGGLGGLQALESMSNLGIITTSYGIENEQEILTSTIIAEEAVRDLKLYADYYLEGSIKKKLLYKNQPINAEMDFTKIERLNVPTQPIELKITRDKNSYRIEGEYYAIEEDTPANSPTEINKTISKLPAIIRTQVGNITLTKNKNYTLEDGETLYVYLNSPRSVAQSYMEALAIEPTSKTSSVFSLQMQGANINRSIDYIKQLVTCYNRQANEDKNEISAKTEEFINDRLLKIDTELSTTDEALESYKRRNKLMELQLDAATTSTNTSAYEQKLNEANTQIALIGSLINFANRPGNKHQVLPSNIGLQDEASTSLINEYNKIALERNRLLRTASESSPVVIELLFVGRRVC